MSKKEKARAIGVVRAARKTSVEHDGRHRATMQAARKLEITVASVAMRDGFVQGFMDALREEAVARRWN